MAEKYQITKSRLLYVYGFPNPDKEHKKFKGLLKIGEVLVDNEDAQKDEQALKQLVRDMLSGRKYITEHEGYEIIFVECTTLINSTGCYKAQQVHDCLTNSGVESVCLSGRGKEDIWFKTNLTDVEKAIKAVKEGEPSFNDAKVPQKEISFRPEQKAAIDATVKRFKTKTGTRFLWNAKMRFGKTLSALQVVKEMKYERTLILTHRPVVDEGWYEDFQKIFFNDDSYHYGSKTNGEPFDKLEKKYEIGDSYVYFASMQDLRGSELVGGKIDKNNEIFDIAWDCVIVDEAHEGTQTGLGKSVMAALEKEDTRVLRLSGTPFNLLDSFNQDEIYTWDYVMEQKAKLKWDDEHYGDPNPYADLPKMQICTFTTNKMVTENVGEHKNFSFHEFFRTWTGDEKKDGKKMPDDKKEGDFVHDESVKEFVARLRTPSDDNKYPFSTPEFQQYFRHTFWVLPGVKEAKALEEILKNDDTFGLKYDENKDWFTIVNVAGDGNTEDRKGEALRLVQDAIEDAEKDHRFTITLSCGKLTTGVSIPEWTAVLCMKGSEHTPAATYMQTIFRVQTHAVLDGRQKANCYVFDFAPDRALTAVAETSKMQVMASSEKTNRIVKQSDKKEKEQLANFIELCPIISMDGGKMDDGRFTADKLFEKLKDVYIEKAVRSGYADNSLYDSKILLNLTPQQEAALNQASEIVGKMKATWKPDPITVNKQGFTGIEDAEDSQVVYHLQEDQFPIPAKPVASLEAYDNGAPIPKGTEWTEEKPSVDATYKYLYSSHCLKKDGKWGDYSNPVVWQQYKEYSDKSNKTAEQIKRDEENKEKRARMSVLRGVSIRIPLLVYGADINDDKEEITIDNFAGNKADGTPLVDDLSWEEFMPKGFTKKMFNDLKDCFDPDIFTGAGKRIREMVKEADKLDVEERINYIAKIFGYMHNPDKETVLTPWRVVNMQLSDCLGGYTFYDEDFDEFYSEEGDSNVRVRFVDKGKVTHDVFGDYCSRILEINSKTGLYPLYMAYSLYRIVKKPEYAKYKLLDEQKDSTDSKESNKGKAKVDNQEVWKDVLQDNIFVVCRTHMAVSITRRTLAGFHDYNMNVKCYEHDVNVDDLVRSGILKANNEDVKKETDGTGRHYTYRGKRIKPCEMIDVLYACPDYFLSDVTKGRDFWHVYNAIPKKEKEEINNMRFKAVVGNPPYQLMDGGNGGSSTPIYNLFMEGINKINPLYSSLIMPARWTTGGKGLGGFRASMIEDLHIREFHDFFDTNACFPSVAIEGGICYFRREAESEGECEITTQWGNGHIEHSTRKLKEDGYDIFIRDNNAIEILKKVTNSSLENRNFISFGDTLVHSRNYYNLSNFPKDATSTPNKVSILGLANKKRTWKFTDAYLPVGTFDEDMLHDWKVFASKADGAAGQLCNPVPAKIIGKPELGVPNSVCTETFLAIGPFKTQQEALNVITYMQTKFFRFMVGIRKLKNMTQDTYKFVPALDFTKTWSDKQLADYYNLTDAEFAYIDSMIK